ncbi:hypothetical protein [Pseudovibrio exalbescens]|uniref:hypothetical protein n=1 Tax=Pseudovibrio exalbescens TaxID=197461 RepID=UPI0011AFA00E|nr:hypothetical protein [Pseudovibrio exalbescens]
MEPASSIIRDLGGLTKVAALVGVDIHSVKRWRLAKAKGGTGGFIPRQHVFHLFCHCVESGHVLELEELVFSPEQRAAISALRRKVKQTDEISSSPKPVTNWGK